MKLSCFHFEKEIYRNFGSIHLELSSEREKWEQFRGGRGKTRVPRMNSFLERSAINKGARLCVNAILVHTQNKAKSVCQPKVTFQIVRE